MKQEVIRSYYDNAIKVSSGREQQEHSLDICNNLFRKNGYREPQIIAKTANAKREKRKHNKTVSNTTSLVLPYTTEKDAYNIRNFVRKLNMNIRIVFKPGKKLKDFL